LARGNEFEFNPIALVEDVLIAFAIATALATAFECRRRRRRSFWEFRLVDFFALFFLISVVLAWWKVQHDECMDQEVHRSAIERCGHSVYGGANGPDCIRRLTGIDLEMFPGIEEVELCRASSEDLAEILPPLQAIRTIRTIRILEASPGGAKTFAMSLLKDLKQLRSIDLSSTVVDDSIIPELVKLPQLESIDLHRTEVSPAGVARLRELLPQCWITLP